MDGLLLASGAAFLGGMLSFLSPCVLPLVPGYLCFAAGLNFDDLSPDNNRARIISGAGFFVAGFSAVFIALGAGAAAINPLLLAHKAILAQIAGCAIIALGLHMAGVFRVPLLLREARFVAGDAKNKERGKAATAFLLGTAFAFGWTPCIGPILATILTLAATRDSLGEGVFLLTLYSAGLGLPFLLAAMGVGRFMETSRKLKRHMKNIERGAGALLILTGALIFTGDLQALGGVLLDWFPALARLG